MGGEEKHMEGQKFQTISWGGGWALLENVWFWFDVGFSDGGKQREMFGFFSLKMSRFTWFLEVLKAIPGSQEKMQKVSKPCSALPQAP